MHPEQPGAECTVSVDGLTACNALPPRHSHSSSLVTGWLPTGLQCVAPGACPLDTPPSTHTLAYCLPPAALAPGLLAVLQTLPAGFAGPPALVAPGAVWLTCFPSVFAARMALLRIAPPVHSRSRHQLRCPCSESGSYAACVSLAWPSTQRCSGKTC